MTTSAERALSVAIGFAGVAASAERAFIIVGLRTQKRSEHRHVDRILLYVKHVLYLRVCAVGASYAAQPVIVRVEEARAWHRGHRAENRRFCCGDIGGRHEAGLAALKAPPIAVSIGFGGLAVSN